MTSVDCIILPTGNVTLGTRTVPVPKGVRVMSRLATVPLMV